MIETSIQLTDLLTHCPVYKIVRNKYVVCIFDVTTECDVQHFRYTFKESTF